jgi:hypothetical protein
MQCSPSADDTNESPGKLEKQKQQFRFLMGVRQPTQWLRTGSSLLPAYKMFQRFSI